MQETQPTDNQEPSLEEAVDVDAGIASQVEFISDKLSPPSKEHSGNTLSSEQQTSNGEEEIQSSRREVESLDTRIAQPPKFRYPLPEFRWMVGYERAQDCWGGIHSNVYNFISTHFRACNSNEFGSGQQLSESEKRSIIAALDGWCPQESWDSLLEHFSADKDLCSRLPSILAEALLFKHICSYIFTNPFWYFGCDDKSKPSRTDDLQAPFWNKFGTQLYNLWQSFVQGIYILYFHTSRSVVERPKDSFDAL
jgi:hypothetical protein